MARDKAKTPNQRLLAMLRKPGGLGCGTCAAATGRFGPHTLFAASGKPVSVGVHVAQTRLTGVRIRGHGAGFGLLEAVAADLPHDTQAGAPAFVTAVRHALTELCGAGPVPRLWAAVEVPEAPIRFVTIPRVAPGQVDNAVFWVAKKAMNFDADSTIFDFENRGEVAAAAGPTRLGAMAYAVSRETVDRWREVFLQAGFPLSGLILAPFAHQNLLRCGLVSRPDGALANLHIGQDWSRLEIFAGDDLRWVRVIKTAMAGLEQAVQEALAARPRMAGLSRPDLETQGNFQTAAAASQAALGANLARESLWRLIGDAAGAVGPPPGGGPREILPLLEPVVTRLLQQVDMTLRRAQEVLGRDAVRCLTVSGPLGGSRLFLDFLRERIGLPCLPFDPLGDRAPDFPDPLGRKLPGSVWTQALGAACSDLAITPSALFTFREKTADRAARRRQRWCLSGVALLVLVMVCWTSHFATRCRELQAQRDRLVQETEAVGARTDIVALTRQIAVLRARREALREYVGRNRVIGLWERVLALAPEGVGIGTITAEFGPAAPPSPQSGSSGRLVPRQAADNPAGQLIVEGLVTGDTRLFEAQLAGYVVALGASPLFQQVSVKKSALQTLDGGLTGLHFLIGLGVSPEAPWTAR